jgi:glycosyltransferase involved in cell wall biosynthesis
MKLSLCLATHNEEINLPACLESVKDLVDEIVIVDGKSKDKTVEIAKKYGARVINADNPPMFHINKEKALRQAQGEWVLQLDADERISPALAAEIRSVIHMSEKKLTEYEQNLPNKKLFIRNQKMIEKEQGKIGENTERYVAFFLPRLNYFLGTYLRHGGVYPDGAIRLVKKGKAYFPCKDVHEVMKVEGRVGWLQNPLLHYDSPTFKRYIERNNRYINMMVSQFNKEKLSKDTITLLDYLIIRPFVWFFSTQIRHKGILDGWQGIVFSFFSALRFPKAYLRYILSQ